MVAIAGYLQNTWIKTLVYLVAFFIIGGGGYLLTEWIVKEVYNAWR